ncbi:cold-shock protein [Nocardia sp. NBC_00416]|uniref:cold-shock protein n=1 Tax=Nocardia sp. NBC_00416 TaxID=2975991 RepID=UPI002E1A9ABD
MPQGTVKWFNEDREFGMIAAADGGPDLLVEGIDVLDRHSAELYSGQPVEFEVAVWPKGPQALRVRPS